MQRLASLLLLSCVMLAGCTDDDGTDYCRNHYVFHDEHSDQIGSLTATLSATGLLSVKLDLPGSALSPDQSRTADLNATIQALQQSENVFSLTSYNPCGAATVNIDQVEDGLEASYESECGSDNRVAQVNVQLFESIANLDEVEVTVTTTAAQKHFVISRQCDAAIFRFRNSKENP